MIDVDNDGSESSTVEIDEAMTDDDKSGSESSDKSNNEVRM